jgi:hypothetical protein
VLIVPVLEGDRLLGILEVFSVRVNAFGPGAQSQLRHMAALLAPVLAGGTTSQAGQPTITPENQSTTPRDAFDGLRQQLTEPPRHQKARRLPLVIALLAALVLVALLMVWSQYSRQSGPGLQSAHYFSVMGLAGI